MKKLILIAAVAAVLLSPLAANEEGHEDLADYLPHFLSTYGVNDISEIQLSAVSDSDLEILGDSVMEELINDPWHHSMYDAMLGGEGSSQLAEYHISLARDYIRSEGELPSTYGYNSGYGMPMGMHGGFRSWGRTGSPWGSDGFSSFPMGWPGYTGTSSWVYRWLIPSAGLLIIIAGIIITVILLRKKESRNGTYLSILERRLASGEISSEEFLRLKKILR